MTENVNKEVMLKIFKAINFVAAWYSVPVDIVRAVAWQESRWGNLGTNTKVLSFDAGHGKGIMQIDDRFHAIAEHDSVFDVLLNIVYGVRYLRVLFNQADSWANAIINYNGDPEYLAPVNKWLKETPWDEYLHD